MPTVDSVQSGPVLTVVIPVRDEEECIEALLNEVVAAVDPSGIRYEIVVVNDASIDATPTILRSLSAHLGSLRVLSFDRPYGQSAAISAGVRHARSKWIVTLDGDGQNDPADILSLWTAARSSVSGGRDAVLVSGSRTRRKDPLAKLWLSWTLNRLSAVLLRHPVVDSGCGLKVFRREDYLALPAFDHVHRFVPQLFHMRGIPVVSMPVNHRARVAGKSHYGTLRRLSENVVDVFGVMWLKRRPIHCEVIEDLEYPCPLSKDSEACVDEARD